MTARSSETKTKRAGVDAHPEDCLEGDCPCHFEKAVKSEREWERHARRCTTIGCCR